MQGGEGKRSFTARILIGMAFGVMLGVPLNMRWILAAGTSTTSIKRLSLSRLMPTIASPNFSRPSRSAAPPATTRLTTAYPLRAVNPIPTPRPKLLPLNPDIALGDK